MSAQRTEMHRLQELVRLHRMGKGSREVARLLRMGPNSERLYRRALDDAGLLCGAPDEIPELEALKAAVLAYAPPKPAPQQQSSIQAWRPQVEELMGKGLRPRAIYDRLRLEHGGEFNGSHSAVKRLIVAIARERGPTPTSVAIPVETDPGDVAQVDFGYIGHLWDPDTKKLRRAWVFVMVLGYSRHMFAEIAFDQKTETWLRLHEAAFRELGGVPATAVPDNLKAAVLRAAFGIDGDAALNRSYRELARHYGFKIDPTPRYAAKKKGKVEAGVKYVKRNALAGRAGQDVAEARTALGRWVREVAGMREHGTTGWHPLEVFEREERERLLPLPTRPYELVVWKEATVHADCHVEFAGRLYSVPWRIAAEREAKRRKVWVRATPATVVIYSDDEPVARHDRVRRGLRSTLEQHLPEQRAPYRHRSTSYWQRRADGIGEEVGRFVRELLSSDDVLSQLRKVQAIVSHLEKFPVERARRACERASFYGAYSYQAVRDILRRGLDLEPMPTSLAAPTWADGPPRFARDVRELLAGHVDQQGGDEHGPH